MWDEGDEGIEGFEGVDMADIYIVRWFGHHGNLLMLYGFMGLQSKMSEWVSG